MSYITKLVVEWASDTTSGCTEIYSHAIPINNYENRELINNKKNIFNKSAAVADIVKVYETLGKDESAAKCIDFMYNKMSGPFAFNLTENAILLKDLQKITTCDDKTLIPTPEVVLIKTYDIMFKKKMMSDGTLSWKFS